MAYPGHDHPYEEIFPMLKLGYKASNEQFAPTELLRYGVLAEECGFDSVFVSDHLQPWRHDGGHAPFALVVARSAGGTDVVHHHRDVGPDADIPLPSRGRRAGIRDSRLPVPETSGVAAGERPG